MAWCLILFGIIGFLLLISLLIYWWISSNFTVPPTSKVTERIISLKNIFVSSYIYTKNSDMILFDAGMTTKGMKKAFMEMNIDPKNVKHVFLTHADPDHIGGLPLFENASFYFGKGTKIGSHKTCTFLRDNEQVQVGNINIKAISTPGHRKGHTTYLVDEKYLFSGDLLRLKEGKIKPFFKLISSDHEKMVESVKKIAQLDKIEMLFTAHTGYTGGFKNSIKNWVD